MKRTIILATGILMMLSLIVWNPTSHAQVGVSTSAPTVAQTPTVTGTPPVAALPDEDKEQDVDSGRYGRGGISFKEYLLRREQMINLLRGLPFNVPGNPRLKALQQLKQQEAALLSKTTQPSASGSTGGAAASSTSSTSASAVAVPTWTSVGPEPIPDGQTNLIDGTRNPVSGRVLTIAVHPTDPNKVYVGTAQGGLYRSLDGGQTWTQLMDSAETLAVGAVTIDPLDPTTLFVGTGEGNFCGDCFFGVGFYIIKNAESATPTLLGPY